MPGSPVTRFGTRTLIGAHRPKVAPFNVIEYEPEHIVAIPVAEFNRYRREYQRALRDGSLRQRSAEEWQAQQPQPAAE